MVTMMVDTLVVISNHPLVVQVNALLAQLLVTGVSANKLEASDALSSSYFFFVILATTSVFMALADMDICFALGVKPSTTLLEAEPGLCPCFLRFWERAFFCLGSRALYSSYLV
jgi:hypothetical protein